MPWIIVNRRNGTLDTVTEIAKWKSIDTDGNREVVRVLVEEGIKAYERTYYR